MSFVLSTRMLRVSPISSFPIQTAVDEWYTFWRYCLCISLCFLVTSCLL